MTRLMVRADLLKSHVQSYTRKDGSFVAAHEDKRHARQDSAPATRQPAPTESDAFKRWFGASQVVGENGKPLVVYHGTHGDSVFDTAKRQVWLTHDPEIAAHYAGFNNQALMPLYARIENPLEVRSARDVKRALRDAGWDDDKIEDVETALGYDEEYSWKWIQEGKGVAEALRSLGYDGAKVHDDYASVDEDSPLYEKHGAGTLDHQSWVIFSPNQIKSAVGNSGDFDGGYGSITKSILLLPARLPIR